MKGYALPYICLCEVELWFVGLFKENQCDTIYLFSKDWSGHHYLHRHGWRSRDIAIHGSVCESIWGFARVEADWLEFRKSGEVWQIDAFVTSKSFCMWLLRRPWILVRLGLQFLLLLLLYLLRQISIYLTSTDGVTISAMALAALVGGQTPIIIMRYSTWYWIGQRGKT